MRYITEHDIKNIYKGLEGSDYTLKADESLTPSAKEYLHDKKINIVKEGGAKAVSPLVSPEIIEENKKREREESLSKLRVVEALFLEKISEIMDWDYPLGKELVEIYERLLSGEIKEESLEEVVEETEENEESKETEVSLDSLDLRNGKIIMKLNYLKVSLEEVLRGFDSEEVEIIKSLEGIIKELGEVIKIKLGGK